MFHTLAMISAAADTSLDGYGPLLNLGAVGLVCAVLIAFAKTTVADLKAQRDKAQEDAEELNRELRESVVPAMVEANRVLNRVVTILDDRR
jgi:hypothetical protein